MIRINLLPVVEDREIKGMGGVVLSILVIVGLVVGLTMLDFWKSSQITSSKMRLAAIQKEVKSLESIKQQVEEFKTKNESLGRRIQLIQVLEENRDGPLYVLDALGKAIPERAWLDKVTENRFNATLEGVAWNEKTVAEFMRHLQASPYFVGVELKEIKTVEIRALPLKTFKIQTRFNYSGKIDAQQQQQGKGQKTTLDTRQAGRADG